MPPSHQYLPCLHLACSMSHRDGRCNRGAATFKRGSLLGSAAPHLMQRRMCLQHMVSCKALRHECPRRFPCATSRGARQDAHNGHPRLVGTPAPRDTFVTPGAVGGTSRRQGEQARYGLEGSEGPVNLSRCHGPSWPSSHGRRGWAQAAGNLYVARTRASAQPELELTLGRP